MLGNEDTYRVLWHDFIQNGTLREEVPPPLLQSWRRCAARGVQARTREELSSSQALVATYPVNFLALVRPAMEDLYQFAEGSACVIVFADSNALVIDIVGDQATRQSLETLGLTVGASWSEERQGTNALALALSESFPIQLSGAMHYREALHALYTSAAPIHDLLGQTVGVLGVMGRYEDCHPHTLGMITAAAQAVSTQLQTQAWLNNANDLLSELRTILQSLPEGILLLRQDSIIAQMNARAGKLLGLVPERVTGRYLRDVLPLPAPLAQAIATQQLLTDEELIFDTIHGRVTCLGTLKPLAIPQLSFQGEKRSAMATSEGIAISREPSFLESGSADGFVLILRSIERAQKLAQRILGTRARLTFENIIGESSRIKEAIRVARLAAGINSTVLLHGETGTGKEIFAQSIHNESARATGPFVAINCAAIPRELITTELFGYEGGAFTGADRQGRSGKFEQAHSGTLFLDEIGDMPIDLQASLLRAIETRSIVRIGGQRTIFVDVRIIVATHKNLFDEVQHGTFRSDLYYRLNVLTVNIPALRQRAGDIPLLVQHFLQRQSRIVGRPLSISSGALDLLQQYNWPGNVRELENMLERVTYLTPRATIVASDFPIELPHQLLQMQSQKDLRPPERVLDKAEPSNALKDSSINAEMQAIADAYQACNGHMAHSAALLGISRTTLWRKMVKYGLLDARNKAQ